MDLRELQHIGYRELHYFVAVAEELHFARAAERIGMHQSPLSKAITIMERDLGARLFIRTRSSTRITEFGEMLLPEAKRLLAEATRLRSNLAAVAAGYGGRLHFAVSEEAVLPWIASLLSLSRHEDPDVAFTIAQRSLAEQLDDLRSDVVDAGVVSGLADPAIGVEDDIDSIALCSQPMVVAVRPDSTAATQSRILTLEPKMGPFVLLGGYSTKAISIRRFVQRLAGTEAEVEFAESVPMLFTMVAAGHGIGLLSAALSATVSRPDLVFRPVDLKRARVVTYLLKRSSRRSAAVDRLVERARRIAFSG